MSEMMIVFKINVASGVPQWVSSQKTKKKKSISSCPDNTSFNALRAPVVADKAKNETFDHCHVWSVIREGRCDFSRNCWKEKTLTFIAALLSDFHSLLILVWQSHQAQIYIQFGGEWRMAHSDACKVVGRTIGGRLWWASLQNQWTDSFRKWLE